MVPPPQSSIPSGTILQRRQRRRCLLRYPSLRHSRRSLHRPFLKTLEHSITSPSLEQKMDGVGGYEGWRWIFILEGLLTVVVAFVAPFAIYDSPETATFLTDDERDWVLRSVRGQTTAAGPESGRATIDSEERKFRFQYVRDALTDWQIYVGILSMSLPPHLFLSLPDVKMSRADKEQCSGASLVLCTASRTFYPLSLKTWDIHRPQRSCLPCLSISSLP